VHEALASIKTMKTLLFLLGLVILPAGVSLAQPGYFTMTAFNTDAATGARDTAYHAQFWILSSGLPDSIVVWWEHDNTYRVFADWRRVSYHIPEGHFYPSPFPFAACSTKGRFPGDIRQYRKTFGGVPYMSSRTIATFIDTGRDKATIL
jgi:hypothetical protein